jgi:hypothetical protein
MTLFDQSTDDTEITDGAATSSVSSVTSVDGEAGA